MLEQRHDVAGAPFLHDAWIYPNAHQYLHDARVPIGACEVHAVVPTSVQHARVDAYAKQERRHLAPPLLARVVKERAPVPGMAPGHNHGHWHPHGRCLNPAQHPHASVRCRPDEPRLPQKRAQAHAYSERACSLFFCALRFRLPPLEEPQQGSFDDARHHSCEKASLVTDGLHIGLPCVPAFYDLPHSHPMQYLEGAGGNIPQLQRKRL
mmetsp:Transcript_25064/g.62687  ORF Transcript_25064/g.62687 Transcript_25064/m.62687 type:complete len:209 (+) Transcript_25064:169-795(+)